MNSPDETRVRMIPVAQIRVVNPRVRDKKKFAEIVESIANVGLKKPITVKNPFLTIAGQTAPGDGICLRNASFGIATHDVIVRYVRCRLGDESAREDDCIDLLHGARDCVLDHCSATWSTDE